MDATLYLELCQLYARYAEVVSSGRWEEWPDFFTDTCTYKVQPRENHERGFPLATMSFLSKGMLHDRVYGIRETLFHDPYYQRNVTGLPLLRARSNDMLEVEANYAIFRTKLSQESSVFNTGRYLDQVVQTPDGLRFNSKLCIYDTEMIPNSMIYPI
ncbi:salicylate hydroxylase [Herbaspirillum rubrisubalbicans]|uniref:Salicylate hydroxylase n=1 Tax=Herbaspirillum rubrisubalbicans TaxID=80842 RepID=A0ABX9BWG2_9BURK|nr:MULTISPECIES: aromatic-ring-hydroxylating dioxygenase subunit beta [Herbaspirillum]MCP1576191.1 salicylate 5-hydroxylase small subunit [Herbaspirillum rubrisubalbicans]NQE48937.1 salicylate hydroxylase [Herbaspirillum rubrisubalbicans]RAM62215.1 salicylate hydroxylase [Herbaspirillum rubrisubalbicans]RAN50048.1 salicylate hydroxylase [Herbaspirillum rubrisubalbicans]